MERNSKSEAIILKSYPLAENHKGVVLLTPDKGVVRAMAFGVASNKSKIKVVARPFVKGEVCLYYDPVKESYRVKDFSEIDLFEGLSGSLDKFYRASLWCEIILKSCGGGESEEIYSLLSQSLTILNRAPTKEFIERTGVQFLWRFLIVSGWQPDFSVCDKCHCDVQANDTLTFSSQGLFCEQCSSGENPVLSSEIRLYLEETAAVSIGKSLNYSVSGNSFSYVKRYLLGLIQGYVPGRLKTLEGGSLFL